jgi:hypothetical protein
LKLVLQNVGGAKLGGTESTTLGNPCKYTFCVAENNGVLKSFGGASPWPSLHVEEGFSPSDSAVSLIAITGGPNQLVDFTTTDPDELIALLAGVMAVSYSPNLGFINEGVLFLCPEHYLTLQKGGVTSKQDFRKRLWSKTNQILARNVWKLPFSTFRPHAIRARSLLGFFLGLGFVRTLTSSTAAGAVAGALVAFYSRYIKTPEESLLDEVIAVLIYFVKRLTHRYPGPKFTSPDCSRIVVTGSTAGKFSSFCPGFGVGFGNMPTANLSAGVTRRIDPPMPKPKAIPANVKAERVLLDPTANLKITQIPLSKRTGKINGTVGFLDISKHGGSRLFDRLKELMAKNHPEVVIQRFTKPTFSRPCPDDLRTKIANACKHVVVALAD